MENKFWLFYIIAVSLVLSFGMVSASVPTVEDISNPSISLVANETNNTQQVICRYSDADGYNNISYSDSYFDLGSLVSDNKVNFTSADVNDVWDLRGISDNYKSGLHNDWINGIFFNDNGTRFFWLDNNLNSNCVINQYDLGDSWNITTAVYSGSFTFNVPKRVRGLFFKNSTVMFVVGYPVDEVIHYSNSRLYQYELSDPWNISSASQIKNVSLVDSHSRGVFFDSTGDVMYELAYGDKKVYQYRLNESWNISTLTQTNGFSISSYPQGLFFEPDGSSFFIPFSSQGEIRQYKMSDSWNVSTASFMVAYSFPSVFDLFIKSSGDKLYTGDDTIRQYSIYPSASIQVDQIPYYRSPGNYPVTCEVNDTNSSDSLTEDVSVNSLLASDVNVSSVDFGSLSPGGSSSSSEFNVENYGNVELNSSWNGTDFLNGSNVINVANIDIKDSDRVLTTYQGGSSVWRSCSYYVCDNDEPFEDYKANGLQIEFQGHCDGGDGWIEFDVHTSQGDVVLRNNSFSGENTYFTNTTDLDAVYQGYDVSTNCTDAMIKIRNIPEGVGSDWYVWTHFVNEQQLSGQEEFFTIVNEETSMGEEGDNIKYNPHFDLSVPLGTPAGSYSNIFTHSISQA